MTALPATTTAFGSGATEADFKQFLADQRAFLAELLGVDGTQIAALRAIGAALSASVALTAAYMLTAADRGKVIAGSGTWTLSLPAAATLGDGFVFAVRNTGSGSVTIDPNGTETVDGSTTYAVSPGRLVMFYCDGTGFTTVGRGVTSWNGLEGNVVSTDLYAIGSYIVGRPANLTQYSPGSVVSGAVLYTVGIYASYGGSWPSVAAATLVGVGSWRCVSAAGASVSQGFNGLWQRIN